MTSRVAILTMDGGGPNNLLTTILIKRLGDLEPEFLEAIDVVSGVSSGSVTALALGTTENREAAVDQSLAILRDPEIFASTEPSRTMLLGLTGEFPFLTNRNALEFFTAYFGDLTLGELKLKTIVPALLLDNRNIDPSRRTMEPKMIHNLVALDDAEPDLRCVDVLMRTTGAPIILPVFQGYADGGLFADNPSIGALSVLLNAIRHARGLRARRSELIGDIRLLSIGTGANPHYLEYSATSDDSNWGYRKWLFDREYPFAAMTSVFESGQEYADFLCSSLLEPDRYHRLDPPLPKRVRRHHHSQPQLEWIEEVAWQVDLTPTVEWLHTSGWLDGGDDEKRPELA